MNSRPQQVSAAADVLCMLSSETICDISCHANLPHVVVCPGTLLCLVGAQVGLLQHPDGACVPDAEQLVKRVLKRKQSGS